MYEIESMYHTIQSRMKPINTFIRAYSTYSRRELYELIQINRRDFDSQLKRVTDDVAFHATIINDQLTRELSRHHDIHILDANTNNSKIRAAVGLGGIVFITVGANAITRIDKLEAKVNKIEAKINKPMDDK